MPKRPYPLGWSAGAQACGLASSSAAAGENAWNVNLNDGSTNNNNRSNQNAVRVVRAGQ